MLNNMPDLDFVALLGTYKLHTWAPGNQVVFFRPWNIMILFTMFLFFLGVGLGALGLSPSFEKYLNATGFFALWGVVGLLLWMGFHGTLYNLPHTVTFNWTVTSSALLRTWALPFHEIGEIILQKKVALGGTAGRVVPMPHCYGVQLRVAKKGGRNPPLSFILLESDSYGEWDFSLAFEKWTSLLQVLSESLHIPGQVSDVNGKLIRTV